MDGLSKPKVSTAEDVERCNREFQKMARKLYKGKVGVSECEDMLLDALDYGSALVWSCKGLQNKHASKRPGDEVDTISDGDGDSDSKCSP